MKEYLERLNDRQLAAVTTKEQYTRVIAGAGSGKTKVLTSRIAYLIDELNVESSKILAFTFTNKAAKEMKERVNKLIGNFNSSYICTYHSFCNKLLREDISYLGFTRNFVIIDESDQTDIIKEIKKDYDEFKQFKIPDLINFISHCKTYNIVPKQALINSEESQKSTIPARIYMDYCKYLKEHNYLDFDDLIIYAVEVLSKFEFIKEKWRNRFNAILVDEFQDTDNLQYDLLKLLVKKDTSIFVVGDPDQTIYTWRGANIDIIFDFENDFKGTKNYILNVNYRSTSSILNCANSLIKHNKNRFDKDLISNGSEGSKPLLFNASSQDSEAEWIAGKIEKSVNDYNLKYKDFAILYRSNYYSGMIERALIQQRIPYEIYGNFKFYERKEIKDCMSYLRLICNSNDAVAFMRVINVPKRGVGNKTIDYISDESKKMGISYFEYCNSNFINDSVKEFIDIILKFKNEKDTNISNFGDFLRNLLKELKYLEQFDPVDDEDRIENVQELSNILFNCQCQDPDATLDEIISDLTLYSSQDSIKDDNVVKLMTVHTAKGLEFPYVFVAGLSNGVFPTSRALNSLNNEKALEEERRLAYVAFTRAKNNLFLSYNTGYSYTCNTNLSQSMFVDEIKNYVIINQSTLYGQKRYFENEKMSNLEKNNKIIENKSNFISDGSAYRPGMIVKHIKFGNGIIISVDENFVTIAFEDSKVGVKKIGKKFNGLSRV